jgi:hypothetical protein
MPVKKTPPKFRSPRKESVLKQFMTSNGPVSFMATQPVRPKSRAEVERRTIAGQFKKLHRKVTKDDPFVKQAVTMWEGRRR